MEIDSIKPYENIFDFDIGAADNKLEIKYHQLTLESMHNRIT